MADQELLDVPNVPDDADLARRLREQRALLTHSKAQIAQRLKDGLYVDPAKIGALTKAEVGLANLEQYHRLRELTRG